MSPIVKVVSLLFSRVQPVFTGWLAIKTAQNSYPEILKIHKRKITKKSGNFALLKYWGWSNIKPTLGERLVYSRILRRLSFLYERKCGVYDFGGIRAPVDLYLWDSDRVGWVILLTLVLLNCFNCIFRHLKLELLTQFPASNDEKYYYLWEIDMSKIKLLDHLSIY